MNFNENMLKRIRIFICFGFMIVFAVVLGLSTSFIKSCAEDTHQDIGMHDYEKEGVSKIGVKIVVDGKVEEYAYEKWVKKSDNTWDLSSCYALNNRILNFSPCGDESGKYTIEWNRIKRVLPDDCNITLSVLKNGECIRSESENTYDTSSYIKQYSLLEMKDNPQKDHITLCESSEESESFIYNITTAATIGKDRDVNATTEYSSIVENGYAFYDIVSQKYIINKLPDVKYCDDENYMYQFLGWCKEEDDCEKFVHVGDDIAIGDSIYAKWKKINKKYTVTLVDKVITGDSEEILGTQSVQVEYGEKVKASDYLGSDTSANAYYQGRYYTGKEDAVVVSSVESLNTVSRYFENIVCDVNVVDKVLSGPNEGKILGEKTIKRGYSEKVYGEDIGCDKTNGRYYTGYIYSDCSELTVNSDGDTVYRYFEPVSYSIEFDGNGATSGDMTNDTEYFYDVEYNLPINNFIKESKVILNKNADDAEIELSSINVKNEFIGWSKEKESAVIYNDSDSFINLKNENVTEKLYANWKSSDFSISVVPKRKGYLFAGWAEDPNAEKGTTSFKVMDDKVLYAVWIPDSREYTIQILKENVDGNYEVAESIVNKKEIGDIIRFYDLAMPKDKYTGYILNEKKSDKEVKVESDGTAVIKVYYDRCRYAVNYIGRIEGNESVVATDGAIYGVSYELPKVIGKVNNPNRYKDSKGKIYNPGDKITINENINIYPQFKISYDDKRCPDIYVNYGENVILNENKKTGYNFEGWYSDKEFKNFLGSSQGVFKNVVSDITIYAKWSEPLKYNITYDLKDSGIIIINGDVKSYTYMEKVILPTESQMIIPEGCKFEGWRYEESDEIISEIKEGEYGDKKLCIVVKKEEQNPSDNSNNTGDAEKNNQANGNNQNNASDNKNNSSSGGNNLSGDKGGEKKPESIKNNSTTKKSGVVKKGSKYTIKNIKYIVTKSTGNSREVKVTGLIKSTKTLVIPDTVTIKGKKYKVTSIGDKAFDKCKSIRTVSIGYNIITIGKEAFYKSSNIKLITIKSKIVKNIGKNAFTGLKSKCTIKISAKSKSLKKVYKSVLSNKKVIVKKYK